MPSGGLTPLAISDEDLTSIEEVLREAQEHGLLWEWLTYFLGGIKAGVDPAEAAHCAAIEWDF